MPHYKLTYFNVTGKGEVARLLFAVAGVQYEDRRFERDEWPAIKPTTPFGQVPVLEVDDLKLCQSNAICRYLANKFDLAGKSDWEKAQADMIVDCAEDVVQQVIDVLHAEDETRKATLKQKLKDQIPTIYEKFEKFLKENKGGDVYFVGDSLTWADLAVFHSFTWFGGFIGLDVPLDDFPKLKAFKQKVGNEQRIAEWLKIRPVTS